MASIPYQQERLRAMTNAPLAGKRVLVVDDEPTVREVLAAYLDRDGFKVREAADGLAALQSITEEPPDLIVLDVMIPKIDGLSILSETRRHTSIPVILLTARAEEADRILGLELGADDYVVKPFSPREVVARVRAVLKRTGRSNIVSSRLDYGPLVINGLSREAFVDNQPITMTPKEFDLLFYLASSPRQVFSRAQLLDHVWDSSAEWQDPATVTVHMARLRRKIEADPEQPSWLTTVWGVGYRFES